MTAQKAKGIFKFCDLKVGMTMILIKRYLLLDALQESGY